MSEDKQSSEPEELVDQYRIYDRLKQIESKLDALIAKFEEAFSVDRPATPRATRR